ncbi:MAG: hypothetical protein GW892_28545, partial [Armatimonadetes bacterium]|nr:hypothetical protein [Armatimonadota bacterium]
DTLDDVRKSAPVYIHAVAVDPETAFVSGALPPPDEKAQCAPVDLRLRTGAAAIDCGAVLPGFNDGFAGGAPDLGAYELGSELPHDGPRR